MNADNIKATNIVSFTEPCGGNLSLVTGHITSPGFPKNYKNYEYCSWIVEVPPESTVVLSFKSFDLERFFDYVEVYKGETTESEPVGNYTSNEIPFEAIMETSFLIVFKTDSSVTRQGFSLYWNTYKGKIDSIELSSNV